MYHYKNIYLSYITLMKARVSSQNVGGQTKPFVGKREYVWQGKN